MVKQQHSTKCGAACVAMLTGMPLKEARSAIQFSNDGDYRTYPSDLRRILATTGIRLGRKVACFSWKVLLDRPIRAVVAVRHHVAPKGLDRWHWVLFDGSGDMPRVLDPERGIRTDFGRIHLSWYHLVIEDEPSNSSKLKPF